LKELSQKEFPVQAMFELEALDSVGSSQSETDGYLFKLDSVEPLNEEEFKEKEQEIRKGLTEELTQLHFSALISFLHRSAKIKINEDIIRLGR